MEARRSWGLRVFFLLSIASFFIATALGADPSPQTSRYIFLPSRSEVVQTGGFAGVHWTYAVEGQFCLIVNADAGSARFKQVDADAVDISEPRRAVDPNEVFNLTGLTGTIVDEATVEFTGQTADGSSVLMTLIVENGTAHLTGQTTPPPNSADFFIFRIDATATRKYASGTGEPNTPYLIATAEQMNAIGTDPNDWDKHFQLTADIDLSAYESAEFNIIGDYDNGFKGSFDGKGHLVSNFICELKGAHFAGLFGRILCGTIKDLHLVDPNVQTRAVSNVGALVGMNIDGVVSGCSVRGGVVIGGETTGGLIGNNGGTIVNCSSWCRVEGGSVGGLAGQNGGGAISMCYSMGEVLGYEAVGGLVGQNGRHTWGREGHFYPGLIDYSYSTCAVTGSMMVGGLVGFNQVGTVEQGYAAGLVYGKENAGGLIGLGSGWAEVLDCFWDVDVSGQDASSGGMGLTTEPMQMIVTFLEAGWDFVDETENGTEEIWWIDEGQDYPHLWWEVEGDN